MGISPGLIANQLQLDRPILHTPLAFWIVAIGSVDGTGEGK